MTAAPARLQALDALRGVAIALVMVRHAVGETLGAAGIVGVVMFFALSGYLITGNLVDDHRRFGRIRFGRFYLHRALRLVPALVLLLAVYGVVEGVFDATGERHRTGIAILLGISYTMNLPWIGDKGSPDLNHLWTLATEEQFYLLWPLLLLIALRRRLVVPLLVVAAVAVMGALAMTLAQHAPEYVTVYTWPASWAVALVIGAAARLSAPRLRALLAAGTGRGAVLALLALAGLLLLTAVPMAKYRLSGYLLVGPLVALLTVVIVVVVSEWRPSRWLTPLAALGTVSYAGYLWNLPIANWFAHLGAHPFWSIPATIAAAAISWFAVERPIGILRRRLDARWRSAPEAEDGPDRLHPDDAGDRGPSGAVAQPVRAADS